MRMSVRNGRCVWTPFLFCLCYQVRHCGILARQETRGKGQCWRGDELFSGIWRSACVGWGTNEVCIFRQSLLHLSQPLGLLRPSILSLVCPHPRQVHLLRPSPILMCGCGSLVPSPYLHVHSSSFSGGHKVCTFSVSSYLPLPFLQPYTFTL